MAVKYSKKTVKSNHVPIPSKVVNYSPAALSIKIKPEQNQPLISVERLRDIHGNYYEDLLPNPDPVLKKLGFAIESNYYENIMTDDQVEACIESIADGVMSLEWEIFKNNADDKTTEAVQTIFKQLEVEEIVEQVIETPLYGRQYMAVDWFNQNGIFTPIKVEACPIALFQYQIDGTLKMKGEVLTYDQDIPPYRLLNPRHKASMQNPYGRSVLSKCYWLAFFKKNARQFWNIFSERFGMPWVVSQIDYALMQQFFPNEDISKVADKLVTMLKNMAQDAIFALPKGIDTQIEKTGDSSSTNNFKLLEDSMNLAMARVILGHSGSSLPTAGKLGNETGAMDIRADKIVSRKRIVTKTFNKLIKWWSEINYNSQIELPVFRFYEEDDINKELAEVLAMLFPVGIQAQPKLIEKEFGWIEGEDFIITQTGGTPLIQSTALKGLLPIAQSICDGELRTYIDVESQIKVAFPEIKPLQLEKYIGLTIDYSDKIERGEL